MKSLLIKAMLVIFVVSTGYGCSLFRSKKESPPAKPEQFRLITDGRKRIALETPGLGWRKAEKSPFSLMLMRDGASVQIGVLISKESVSSETLLRTAMKKLRINPNGTQSFKPWDQDSRFFISSGGGSAMVSPREKYTVERLFSSYYYSEKQRSVLLLVVGSQDDLSLVGSETELIVKSLRVLK